MKELNVACLVRTTDEDGHFVFLCGPKEIVETPYRNGRTYLGAQFKSGKTKAIVFFNITDSDRREIYNIQPVNEEYGPKDFISEFYQGSTRSIVELNEESGKHVEMSQEYKDGWINGIWVSSGDKKIMATALRISKELRPVNIMFVGPSGYGKTSVPLAFAKQHNMEYLRVNCASVRDPEEWFGYREARQGNTEFIPTDFTRVVRKGNAIVVMDEFNRVEPWLHNTLYPLLDHDRRTTVHNELIECGHNVVFVATINQGYAFTGTFLMDQALKNRMDAIIHVNKLPESIERQLLVNRTGIDEATATWVVNKMNTLRSLIDEGKLSVDASTRTSIKVSEFISAGILSKVEAVAAVVLGACHPDELKTATDAIGGGRG